MSDVKGGVIINDDVSDPVGDYVIDYLLAQTKETTFHDFKWTVDITKDSQDFTKIIKDVYAFSNYGGGWLVLGVKQNDHSNEKNKGKFIKAGLPDDFELEDASLQEKINSFLDEPISIQYTEFTRTINRDNKKFALIYFPPSSKIMVSKKDIKYNTGNKERTAVLKNIVYTRRGTQSIIASDYEKKLIKNRLEKENYRLSILNGEPENVHEIIYSNLFEVTKLPEKVYLGTTKYNSFPKILEALRLTHPGMYYFPLNLRFYEDKIVTFANLNDVLNIHREIVDTNKITQESVADWLENEDKEKIIISLLNKEVTDKARGQGMQYDNDSSKLYYALGSDQIERKEEWPSRYRGLQKKQVSKKRWSDKLKRYICLHAAIRTRIMRINTTFYLRLNLTMVVTEDGKKPVKGMKVGAIITGETYRIYNKGQLNLILFWINKLGGGTDISVISDFEISNEPVHISMDTGISWDIPTSDFKQIIAEFDAEAEQARREEEFEIAKDDFEERIFEP